MGINRGARTAAHHTRSQQREHRQRKNRTLHKMLLARKGLLNDMANTATAVPFWLSSPVRTGTPHRPKKSLKGPSFMTLWHDTAFNFGIPLAIMETNHAQIRSQARCPNLRQG
jgi:hypothetical protein